MKVSNADCPTGLGHHWDGARLHYCSFVLSFFYGLNRPRYIVGISDKSSKSFEIKDFLK